MGKIEDKDELDKYAINAWVNDGGGKEHTEQVVQLKIAKSVLATKIKEAEIKARIELDKSKYETALDVLIEYLKSDTTAKDRTTSFKFWLKAQLSQSGGDDVFV